MKSKRIQEQFVQQSGGNIRYFQQLLDLIPDIAFFVKDKKGRFIMMNRRNCEVCGINSEEEAFGKTDYDVCTPECAEKYVANDREVMTTNTPIINGIEESPDFPNRRILFSKVPVHNKQGRVIGVAGIHRTIDSVRDIPECYGKFAKLIEYITRNYAKPITLRDLTPLASMSERQLERRFRQLTGLSISEYIVKTRINAARELITFTDKTLADIATSVGFYDHSHFTNSFKRLMACTPSRFRRLHRESR
jgi:AraC-like DNA-binding protein